MHDPVVTSSGQTFESNEIRKWLLFRSTCPLTNTLIRNTPFYTNDHLKSQIRAFVELHWASIPIEDYYDSAWLQSLKTQRTAHRRRDIFQNDMPFPLEGGHVAAGTNRVDW